jgi:hypothetical protein
MSARNLVRLFGSRYTYETTFQLVEQNEVPSKNHSSELTLRNTDVNLKKKDVSLIFFEDSGHGVIIITFLLHHLSLLNSYVLHYLRSRCRLVAEMGTVRNT